MEEHTPEPWHIGFRTLIFGSDDKCLLRLGKPTDLETQANAEANIRRVVACVNACAGIPTETLEQVGDEVEIWIVSRDPREDPSHKRVLDVRARSQH